VTHPDPDLEAEIGAIRDRMAQPLSREQIVANELWAHLDGKQLSTWTNDDWLRLARHMIKAVEIARDIPAEEMAKAMNEPRTGPPLPTFDEL
jgi:hypothetical protein